MRSTVLVLLGALALGLPAQPPVQTPPSSLNVAHWLHHGARDWKAAIEAYQQLAKDDTGYRPLALTGIAQCREALGEREAAMIAWHEVLKLDPSHEAAKAAVARLSASPTDQPSEADIRELILSLPRTQDPTTHPAWNRLMDLGAAVVPVVRAEFDALLTAKPKETSGGARGGPSQPSGDPHAGSVGDNASRMWRLFHILLCLDQPGRQAVPEAWTLLGDIVLRRGDLPQHITSLPFNFFQALRNPRWTYARIGRTGPDGLLGLFRRIHAAGKEDPEVAKAWSQSYWSASRSASTPFRPQLVDILLSDDSEALARYSEVILPLLSTEDPNELQQSIYSLDQRLQGPVCRPLLSAEDATVRLIAAATLANRNFNQPAHTPTASWRIEEFGLTSAEIETIHNIALQALMQGRGVMAEIGYRILCQPGPRWSQTLEHVLLAEAARSFAQFDGTRDQDRLDLIPSVYHLDETGWTSAAIRFLIDRALAKDSRLPDEQRNMILDRLTKLLLASETKPGADGQELVKAIQEIDVSSFQAPLVEWAIQEEVQQLSRRGPAIANSATQRLHRRVIQKVFSSGDDLRLQERIASKLWPGRDRITEESWRAELTASVRSFARRAMLDEQRQRFAINVLASVGTPEDFSALVSALRADEIDSRIYDEILKTGWLIGPLADVHQLAPFTPKNLTSIWEWASVGEVLWKRPALLPALEHCSGKLDAASMWKVLQVAFEFGEKDPFDPTYGQLESAVRRWNEPQRELIRATLAATPVDQFVGAHVAFAVLLLPREEAERILVTEHRNLPMHARIWAIHLIGRLLVDRGEPIVREALGSFDPQLTGPALDAIELLQRARRAKGDGSAAGTGLGAATGASAALIAPAADLGADVPLRIKGLLTSGHPEVRMAALEAAHVLPTHQALSLYLDALGSGHLDLREAARKAIQTLRR